MRLLEPTLWTAGGIVSYYLLEILFALHIPYIVVDSILLFVFFISYFNWTELKDIFESMKKYEWQNVLAFDKEKIAVFVLLALLAPVPFFVLVLAGWIPVSATTIYAIAAVVDSEGSAGGRILLGGSLVINAIIGGFLLYWLSSVLTRRIERKWILWSIIVVLAIASLFSIYAIGDAGGGHHTYNIQVYQELLHGRLT